jgi:cell division protein FtsW
MGRFKKNIDIPLLVITGLLLLTGFIVLYSASTVESYKLFKTSNYFFFHQLLYGGGIGLVALYVASRIDYHRYKDWLPYGLILVIILLILVKVPGIGFSAGGAFRWIHVGPIFFQPAELAKLMIIMYTSSWLAERQQQVASFKAGVLPALAVIGVMSGLILWQPDVGTMMVVAATGLVLLFVGGVRLSSFAAIIGLGAAALALIVKLEPYRLQRLLTFLDPSHDTAGIGYHINQALLAIGSGGLFGLGYGLSHQKVSFLPEVLGDSIFAVMAEELGFLRVLGVLALFLLFTIRGVTISMRAGDVFGKLLAAGITAQIIVQALINIAAITGLVPLTGIPLPFFSYGSSSLLITMLEIGILLNISKSIRSAKPSI